MECNCFTDIVSVYKNAGCAVSDFKEFQSLIEGTRISSFDENGEKMTDASLGDHLCAEIRFNKRSYFLFNQEWYLIKPDFETTLNKQCQEFINTNQKKGLLKKWKTGSENDFNSSHIGDKDTLVFDKITPENIEACDVLKWTDEEVFFIHIKKGFNNEMRNLGRQVQIAARRINEDLKTDKKFLGKLYDDLANINATTKYFKNAKAQLSRITKSEFLNLFENRKLTFVVAILDSSTKGKRDFTDITKYDSNIAKFCLQQLRQEMRNLDIELMIVDIEK